MKLSAGCIRITALLGAVLFAAASFAGCAKKPDEYTSFAMGSVLTAKIYTQKEEDSKALFEKLSAAAGEADRCLSATREDSDISKVNKKGSSVVSDFTLGVIKDSIQLCHMWDRSIDITMGAVTELWGFSGEAPHLPADEDIKNALLTVDLEKAGVDSKKNIVSIGENQKLDLGAFGKGAACDAMFEELSKTGAGAVVDLGGNILLCGEGPSDGKWRVGIRNPFENSGSYFAVVELSAMYPKNAAFISTSGSYEKRFTQNGKDYHHILSPKTGYPAESEIAGVTVISQSGIVSDALSTACFIDGLTEKTLERLGYYHAEAIFVFEDKSYYITPGLEASFTVEDSSFVPVTES